MIVRFAAFFTRSSSSSDAIESSLTYALDIFISHLTQVLTRCQEVIVHLENLDHLLGVVHGIVSRERLAIDQEKQEVLESLWTHLGGNTQKLRGLRNHLVLLRGISTYRHKALGHVHRMLDAIEDVLVVVTSLRGDALVASLSHSGIPLAVQLADFRAGLERLTEGGYLAEVRIEETVQRVMRSIQDST